VTISYRQLNYSKPSSVRLIILRHGRATDNTFSLLLHACLLGFPRELYLASLLSRWLLSSTDNIENTAPIIACAYFGRCLEMGCTPQYVKFKYYIYSGNSVYVLNPFQILGLIPNRMYTERIFPIRNKGKMVNLFP
jgi:hypothetical protein